MKKTEAQLIAMPGGVIDRACKQISDHHDKRKLTPVSVTTADGEHYYKGGLKSQRAIEDSEKYSAEKGLATVYVNDSNRTGHQLSFADSKAVRLAIAEQYISHYKKEQAALLAAESATTKAEVDQIVADYLAL